MTVKVPLMCEVDLLIFGATAGAVAAALAARRNGRSVLCATSHTYPGEDVAAVMNYWNWGASGESPSIAPDLFGRDFFANPPATPLRVKFRLEQAMVEAGVDFLYMVHPFRCLRDANGGVAGAVLADRSGFQAVRAGTIIDATEHAQFARLLPEAEFHAFASGDYELRRVVLGRTGTSSAANPGRALPGEFAAGERKLLPRQCRMTAHFSDPGPAAMARADVDFRLNTWFPQQLYSSDRTEMVYGDRLRTVGHHQAEWSGAEAFDLAAMACGDAAVFVLGPMADVSDSVAEILRDPCAITALGDRLGRAVSTADRQAVDGEVRVGYEGLPRLDELQAVRYDAWYRMADHPHIEMDLSYMPVLGEFDVVVAGGGTAGAPAGIAGGRAGARTLILEYLAGLGGMGTEGRIAAYYHGNKCGFTSEIDQAVRNLGDPPDRVEAETRWNTEWKKYWLLKAARDAGTEVWFGAMTLAAAVQDNDVRGVVVATPAGCGLIKARKVVDATGNADVAAAAGADTADITTDHIAVQGTGLSRYVPGEHYANSDYTFVDDNDLVDVTRAFAVARTKFRDCFDVAQIVESRERRQIKGELTLEPLDFLAGRTFQDTVVTACSNFDSHGFTVHPVFLVKPPDREELSAHVSYRCLLPAGLEGVLVTGLAVSSHRDSLPVIRMQPDVQNQGYAAGRAAAMAAQEQCALRRIDMKALQQHLVQTKILAPEVLEHQDSPPLTEADFAEAAANGKDDYLGLAILFSDPERSRPLLRDIFQQTKDDAEKQRCALILALLGDDSGLDVLLDQVAGGDWDQGWHYTGMGQFGFSMSEIDSVVVALGRTRNRRALPAVLEKLKKLSPESEFSHCRAVSMALQAQPTADATGPLTRLLDGLAGNSRNSIAAVLRQVPGDQCDTSERNRELKELVVARALLNCGDDEGRAKQVLEGYVNDVHGHYARHARTLLKQTPCNG